MLAETNCHRINFPEAQAGIGILILTEPYQYPTQLVAVLLRIGTLFLDAYLQTESFQLKIATHPTDLTPLKNLIRVPRNSFSVFMKEHTNKVVLVRTCCACDCFGWMIAVHEIFWYKIQPIPMYNNLKRISQFLHAIYRPIAKSSFYP
jgi:hypothetical protein